MIYTGPAGGRSAAASRTASRVTLMVIGTGCSGIGALVVGGDYQGLGIVRSLGRRGVPVCVVDDEYSIARYSRFTDRAVRVADLSGDDETVQALVGVGRRLGLHGWVIYPTRDETVAALARNREALSSIFRVATPSWETVRWLCNKRHTYELAERVGLPVPRTWYPRSVEDLDALDGAAPVVIKPAVRGEFLRVTKAKAWQANDRSELHELYERARLLIPEDELMLQELIPGGGRQQFAYCAFFKGGRPVASMVARRWRQHPPDFGRASTFVETLELPEIERLSERFLESIDYYGLVEMEYKLDARDGQYKLLDVNARTWGYHTLGQRAGVDFPYLLFADQLGESVQPPVRARPGVRWMRLVTDLPTALLEIRRGRLDWRAYARSVRATNAEAVFSREDPLPGLMELALLPYLYVRRGF